MIKIRLIGYHFHNCPDFYVNRPNGSGDYLLLYLRSPTEIMTDNKCIRVPKNTFILYQKNKPQIYRHIQSGSADDYFINDWIILILMNMITFLRSLKFLLTLL